MSTNSRNYGVPRTMQEISAAELDGNILTGLEIQTAFDGSAIDEATLRAVFDGDVMSRARHQHGIPVTRQEITARALDGNVMTGLDIENARTGNHTNEVDRRVSRDGNPFNGIDRRETRLERDYELTAHEHALEEKMALPTPWDRPSPSPWR